MNRALIIVDVQKEFLGERLDYIAPLCQKYLNEHGSEYDRIILTQWRHDQNRNESTLLLSHPDAVVVDKFTYSALNEDVKQILQRDEIKEIHIAGVDAELSVLATMFAAIDAGYDVSVLERLVSSFHELSWEAMRIAKKALGDDKVLRIAGGRVYV